MNMKDCFAFHQSEISAFEGNFDQKIPNTELYKKILSPCIKQFSEVIIHLRKPKKAYFILTCSKRHFARWTERFVSAGFEESFYVGRNTSKIILQNGQKRIDLIWRDFPDENPPSKSLTQFQRFRRTLE